MGKPLREWTIETVSEFNDRIFSIFNEWQAEKGFGSPLQVWFRGQDRDDPLLPKVLRKVKDPNTGKEAKYNENHIHQAFSSLYRNYTSERFEDRSSEYYSFMQHYGIPTRLLDWTENGVMALYFAANGGRYDQKVQRVVWVMNPGALNRLTRDKISYAPLVSTVPLVQVRLKLPGSVGDKNAFEVFMKKEVLSIGLSAELVKFPIAFWPSSSGNIRIAAQKGCFTIHGTEAQPIESFFDNSEISKYLVKIKIRNESVPLLREQLRLLGLTPVSVYPDLFGLATELSGPRYMVAEMSEDGDS